MGGQCTKNSPSSIDDVHEKAKRPGPGHAHPESIHNMEEALQFPPWCFKDVVIDEHIRLTVNNVWKKVLSGECRPFKEAKAVRPTLTPLAFFYNVFYDSFFSLVPESLPLYIRGIQTQGRMLAHIVHFIVTNLDCGDEFDSTLKYLAVMHNQRAVNPCHYGTMGLCLLFSIRRVVGDENFDADARYCWTCLYSRMMQVIIPLAVSKKMEHDKDVLQKMYHYKILDSVAGSEDSESTISRNNAGPGNVPITPTSLSIGARGRNPPLTPNMNHHIITHEEEPDSPGNPPPRMTLGLRAQKNSAADGLPDPESVTPKVLEKNAAIAARLIMHKGSKKEVSRSGNEGEGAYVAALHPDVAAMEEQIHQAYQDIDSPRGPPPPPPPEDDDTPLPPPKLPTTPLPDMPTRAPPAAPSASPTPPAEPSPVPQPSPKQEVPLTDVSITGQVFNRSLHVHVNPHGAGGGMYGSLRQKHIPNAPVGVNAPAPPMGAPLPSASPTAAVEKTPKSANRPTVNTSTPPAAAASAADQPRPSPKEMEADAKSFASAMSQMTRQRQASATNLNTMAMNMSGGVMSGSGRHQSPNAGLIPHSPV